MGTDDIPRTPIALMLTGWMAAVYFVNPPTTPLSYTFLAPWMHAGWPHLWQNLFVFILLGVWVENRVGWLTFLIFVVLIPYLALYLPVVGDYGGLSRGASGLTMALTGYVIPVLVVGLANHLDSFQFKRREVAVGGLIFLAVLYLTTDAFVTVKQFLDFAPRPAGVAVSVHFTGLILGATWFGYRVLRHGIFDT